MTNIEFKEIRWKQRFENYQKSLVQLDIGLKIESPSNIEEQGIIKAFELTFELAWKTLKDYLESQGVEAKFPREVIKSSFENGLIANGEMWLEMLGNRNLLSHVYNQTQADSILELIKQKYTQQLRQLQNFFINKLDE